MILDTRELLNLNTSHHGANHDIRAILDSKIFYSTPRHAEYLVYRRFDKTRLSEFWDAEKHEAIDGYKYEYNDSLIIGRCSWFARGSDQEDLGPIGRIGYEEPYAHIRFDSDPKVEDIIYSLKVQPGSNLIVPGKDNFYAQYNIKRVVPYKDINGRVEFYTCLLKEELLDVYR